MFWILNCLLIFYFEKKKRRKKQKIIFEQFSKLVHSTTKGQKLAEPNLILSCVSTGPCGDPLLCFSHSRMADQKIIAGKRVKKIFDTLALGLWLGQLTEAYITASTPRLVRLEKATGCG